jgi:hypothetical protein
MTLWYILWSLVYFSRFGILYRENSGSPVRESRVARLVEFLPTGRLFTLIFEKYRRSLKFWADLFPRSKPRISFDKKMAWATFWATFWATHLVTLRVRLACTSISLFGE